MGSNSPLEVPQPLQGRQAVRVSRSASGESALENATVLVVESVGGFVNRRVRKSYSARLQAKASEPSLPTSDFYAAAVRQRLQSVEARQAILDAFNATPDELGEAAVALAAKTGASRKQPL